MNDFVLHKLFSNLSSHYANAILKRLINGKNTFNRVVNFCKKCDDLKLNYYSIAYLFPNIPRNEFFSWKIIDQKTFPNDIIKENLDKITANNFNQYDIYSIFESLIIDKNNRDIYEYHKLIELFPPNYIISILEVENLNFDLLPNFDKLIKIIIESKHNIDSILDKIINNKNYDSLIIIMNSYRILKDSSYIRKIIIFFHTLEFDLAIYILSKLNSETFASLINNESFYNTYLKKLSVNKLNILFTEQNLENLDGETINKIINLYEDTALAILSNNKLYEKSNIKQKPNFFEFLIYTINNNSEKYLKYFNSSDAIFDFFKNFPLLHENDLHEYLDKYPIIKKLVLNNDHFLKMILQKIFIKLTLTMISNDHFTIFSFFPELLQKIVYNRELLNEYLFILDDFYILDSLKKYPNLEKILLDYNNMFIHTLLTDKQIAFKHLPLINHYNIKNEMIDELNSGFKQIQNVRNELSLQNSSLKEEMFFPDFISTLGLEYINAILEYDSKASDIAVKLYKDNKLSDLKIYLDFLTTNIKNSRRMIHFYILAFNSTNNLVFNLNNIFLTNYQKQILEEIIANDNKYQIQNIDQLNNYFSIRSKKILSEKEVLTDDDVLELFLNQSARYNGEPWNIKFFEKKLSEQELEYFKYKYVDSGTISISEYEYLVAVNNILKNNCDINLIIALLNNYLDKEVPSIRSIYKKMDYQFQTEFNDQLLDLDEVRKIGSHTDQNAEIYITEQDGIEIIYLNGYDFKCLGTWVSESGTYDAKSSFTNFHQNGNSLIASEKLKEILKSSSINLSTLSGLKIPQSWNLLEAVSTISTSIISSRTTPVKHYGWGKNSHLKINGVNREDAQVSHELRSLKPSGYGKLELVDYSKQTLYASDIARDDANRIHGWTEVWFDRIDSQITQNNQRIQPEFITAFIYNLEDSNNINQLFSQAKSFQCPIVVFVRSKYIDLEEKLFVKAKQNYMVSYDKIYLYDIWYYSKIENIEKVELLLNIINNGYKNEALSFDEFISVLTDLKWFFYENYPKFVPIIEKALLEAKSMNIDNGFSTTRQK